MVAQQFTAEEITAYITRQYGHEAQKVVAQVNGWLARGDGVAVYENVDLGSRNAGACQLVSYGSPAAQLEGTSEPPEHLPDMTGKINFRYYLQATYRGDQLPIPELQPLNDGTPDAIPLFVPADDNPRLVAYRVALDNREGANHREEWGTLKEYDSPGHTEVRYLRPVNNSEIKAGSIFIIDDGKQALPYYSSGTHHTGFDPFEILMPFPVNPDGRMRDDGRGVIDYSNWMLGPRKCYHLKIKRTEA